MKMERKSGLKIFLRRSKKEIMDKAKMGVFDDNPLLATPHGLVCKTCGCTRKITYLSYLKTGRFKLGKTRLTEIVYPAPTLTGLGHTTERTTPVMIRFKCRKCGSKMSCIPVSLEYLLFTTAKEQKSNQMYV
jgi:hypothetical protein